MTDITPAPEGVTPEQVAAMCRTMRKRPYRLASETEAEASLRRINERADAAAMLEALAADLARQKARADAAEAEVKAVLDREAETQRRHDAKIEAAEAKVARLVEALTLAANRLSRRAVEYVPGSRLFIETGEWADEARAAIAEVQG